MTLAEARRVSDLLVTLDDAREWRESFEDGKDPFVHFENVLHGEDIRGNGPQGSWEGPLRLPRELAVEMMAWLETRAIEELQKLGVKPPATTG